MLSSWGGTLLIDVKSERPEDYVDIARLLKGRNAVLICRIASGAAEVKAIAPALGTAALTTVQPRTDIDYRLIDARVELRTPLDVWLRDPTIVFVNQDDYGRTESEWVARADRWGARMIIVNDLASALSHSSGP